MPRETIRLTKLEEGTYSKGSSEADVDLRIDGKIEGKLKTSQKIYIGCSGVFKGEATANNMDLCGHFQGTINVKHKLFIGKSARLEGDVYVGSIEIEEGAHFIGKCFMLGALKSKEDQTKTKQLHPKKIDNEEENLSLTKAAL